MTFDFTYNYPQVARESGFKLRNYKDGPLNWRLIGSLEIERILRDQSFEQIDAILSHLSEVPLGSVLDSNVLDSGIAKYFILTQFSVQYLMFCRKFLEETVTDLRESHNISQVELATLRRSLSDANNEILQLHKKITQMEAIHEVIYPCHLCTKNFISNDALNLHISRKHGESSQKQEKKSEAAKAICNERENDLTLINTIKLELEIKHLKERLNIAEREIKEKNLELSTKNVPENVAVVFDESEKRSVHSIGIQSNLSEVKERDDNSQKDFSCSLQNQQQLHLLNENLQEFEKWKEEQKRQNSQFLNEINKKIQDIGVAIEMANQHKEQVDHKTQDPTSSAEHLELLLTKKADEIGKVAAATLENVANKMEINYKGKLHQIEKALNKLNDLYTLQNNFIHNENPTKTENPIEPQKDPQLFNEASATESNHTFVKHNNVTFLKEHMSEDDATDISDSFLQDESEERIYKEPMKIDTNTKPVSNEVNSNLVKQSAPQSKVMTKMDAKRFINYRLTILGVNTKTKAITPLLKKRYLHDLTEKRSKLIQEHPEFYTNRNKIKKLIDKLCSTSMPPNAKALLKVTKHVKKNKDVEYPFSVSKDEDVASLKTSTPLVEISTVSSGNFKQKLERILASPIRKPDEGLTKVIVHRDDNYKKPVPIPRKRVVFNQPEIEETRLGHIVNVTEGDETQSFQLHPA